MSRKTNGPGAFTDDKTVKKSRNRKEQRHEQRLKEDEIRKVASKEQPTNIKKERKICRELNAQLHQSNVSLAREKRVAELRFLYEIEDDPTVKKQIKDDIWSLIRSPLVLNVSVDDSDDEVVVISNVPSSALITEDSSTKSDVSMAPVVPSEIWGDDAASECQADINTELDQDDDSERSSQHDDYEGESDSPAEGSDNELFGGELQPEDPLPTRKSPRKQKAQPVLTVSSVAPKSIPTPASAAPKRTVPTPIPFASQPKFAPLFMPPPPPAYLSRASSSSSSSPVRDGEGPAEDVFSLHRKTRDSNKRKKTKRYN